MFEKHAVKREIKIHKCGRARCSLRIVMKLSHNKPLVLEICRVFLFELQTSSSVQLMRCQ